MKSFHEQSENSLSDKVKMNHRKSSLNGCGEPMLNTCTSLCEPFLSSFPFLRLIKFTHETRSAYIFEREVRKMTRMAGGIKGTF